MLRFILLTCLGLILIVVVIELFIILSFNSLGFRDCQPGTTEQDDGCARTFSEGVLKGVDITVRYDGFEQKNNRTFLKVSYPIFLGFRYPFLVKAGFSNLQNTDSLLICNGSNGCRTITSVNLDSFLQINHLVVLRLVSTSLPSGLDSYLATCQTQHKIFVSMIRNHRGLGALLSFGFEAQKKSCVPIVGQLYY
ncbi:MAG: hypothetical protein AAB966_05515 [Patescibacteria group bacterium]